MARLPLFAVSAFFALAIGCSGTDRLNPGDPLGEFHVTAKLTSTTCGTAPDPWEFDAKLRDKGVTLYWITGDAPVSGSVDSAAHTTMSSTSNATLRAEDTKNKIPACSVTRTDTLDVSLTDGTNPVPYGTLTGTKAITGTLTYKFTPDSGSMCDDQLLSTGGDYEALPCAISYSLTATKTSDLPK